MLWIALMVCAFITGHVILGVLFLFLWALTVGSAE